MSQTYISANWLNFQPFTHRYLTLINSSEERKFLAKRLLCLMYRLMLLRSCSPETNEFHVNTNSQVSKLNAVKELLETIEIVLALGAKSTERCSNIRMREGRAHCVHLFVTWFLADISKTEDFPSLK